MRSTVQTFPKAEYICSISINIMLLLRVQIGHMSSLLEVGRIVKKLLSIWNLRIRATYLESSRTSITELCTLQIYSAYIGV